LSTRDDKFQPPSPTDVVRLIREHPLAWVVSCPDGEFHATPLPLRPVVDAAGTLQGLLGHFARANPHVEVVRRAPRVLALFLGPHGYISPSWFADRTQAPTWNYATLQLTLDLELLEGEAEVDHVIEDLVGAMEAGRPDAWGTSDMGSRYRRLVSGVIGFRAHIVSRRAKFKLGQDERPDVLADILEGLTGTGQHTLREWVELCNAGRASG
jgi:predicted FMN-binding regulatory protein PaiB